MKKNFKAVLLCSIISSYFISSYAQYNTRFGTGSLEANTTGNYNTAIGYHALRSNTTGSNNQAFGYRALSASTNGSFNTAAGFQSLSLTTAGIRNSAYGSSTLFSNTTGIQNSAFGDEAMFRNSTGRYNTAVGAKALGWNIEGHGNTAIGYDAQVLSANLTNATAIGYATVVNASNKVRIGNTSVTSIGGQVGWTTFSDLRYKRDIKENVVGLAFINSLKPITYSIDIQGLNSYDKFRQETIENSASPLKKEAPEGVIEIDAESASKIIYSGFIAQEVEAAAKNLNFEFSGVDKPKNKEDMYGLRYEAFIVPLVKAVQELSRIMDENEAKINALQKQIDELRSMVIMATSKSKVGFPFDDASLEQNSPNPFTSKTVISYTLPQKYSTARIAFTDINGKIMKLVNISGVGKGTATIDFATIAAGAYNYSLVVDGHLIGTRKLMLIK